MRKIRHFLSAAIFVLSVISLSSTFAQAQDIPDYLFLEALDSNKKPVEGAKVESDYIFGSSYKGYVKQDIKTDEKGNARFYLEGGYYYSPAKSLFSVAKDGYFTFNDLGFPSLEIGRTLRRDEIAQVELLKIPQTKEEQTILGNEQQKREFMWAAKTGDAATVNKLLKSGINPNLNTNDLRGIPGPKDVPAMLLAANSGDGETVKALLKAGVNVREKDEPFRSILLTYLQADPFFRHKFKTEDERKEILRRYEDGVEFLLKAGADFNAEDSDKRKPIMIAAQQGYARAVKMLLDKGFSPNLMDERGTTLLMYAAGNSYPEIKYSKVDTVNVLLKSGADPNLSKDGCSSALGGAAYRGDIEAIQALLKNGAKVDLNCEKSLSPLILAVDGYKVEAAKLLIEAGANMNACYYHGENALMWAAQKNNIEMVRMLLDKGFSVDAKFNGWTPLFYALTSYGSPNPELITMLLKAGASPNVAAEDKTADYCSMPLKIAAEPYTLDILKLLAENGANVNLACANGETALSYAVTRHKPVVVKALIQFGANPNGERVDKALNLIKTLYKEGDYERKDIDETIKIIGEARAKEKNQNN